MMGSSISGAEFLAQQGKRRKGGKKKGPSEADKLVRAYPAFHRWAQRQPLVPGVLWFPMPPNLGNLSWHWQEKNEAHETYDKQLDSLRLQRLLPAPVACYERAQMVATLFLPQEMDQDNSLARVKWNVDWMVRAGYLRDDNPRCLKWEGVPHQEQTNRTPPRLRLEIRERVESTAREWQCTWDEVGDIYREIVIPWLHKAGLPCSADSCACIENFASQEAALLLDAIKHDVAEAQHQLTGQKRFSLDTSRGGMMRQEMKAYEIVHLVTCDVARTSAHRIYLATGLFAAKIAYSQHLWQGNQEECGRLWRMVDWAVSIVKTAAFSLVFPLAWEAAAKATAGTDWTTGSTQKRAMKAALLAASQAVGLEVEQPVRGKEQAPTNDDNHARLPGWKRG